MYDFLKNHPGREDFFVNIFQIILHFTFSKVYITKHNINLSNFENVLQRNLRIGPRSAFLEHLEAQILKIFPLYVPVCPPKKSGYVTVSN